MKLDFLRGCAIRLISALLLTSGAIANTSRARAGDGSENPRSPLFIDPRPVIGRYGLEIGESRIVSTYLSPVEYAGTRFAAYGEWAKVMPFSPEKFMMRFEGEAGGSPRLLNPAGSASMYDLDFRFSWQMKRYWRLPCNLAIGLGGGAGVGGGIRALLKNSNNPVIPDIHASLTAGAEMSWRSAISTLPVLLRMSVDFPIAGAFFMPQYGETFYEIYLGNRKGLVHCLWPGNYPDLNMKIGLAMDFGRTAMEIGYHFQWKRATANNLVDRACKNMFRISIIPGGLRLKHTDRGIPLLPY